MPDQKRRKPPQENTNKPQHSIFTRNKQNKQHASQTKNVGNPVREQQLQNT